MCVMTTLAEECFKATAAAFPVCTASDEFYFFPQYCAEDQDWSRWDDFSEETVEGLRARLARWEEAASGEGADVEELDVDDDE